MKTSKKVNSPRRNIKNRAIRKEAAAIAFNRTKEIHVSNGDEDLVQRLMSFTKGLPHDFGTGLLLNEDDFEKFKAGICSGDIEMIKDTPLGPPNGEYWKSEKARNANAMIRAWESAGAGLTFDLQGADAQDYTMKPAPKLGSDELVAEIAEIYCQAFLRDIPFHEFENNADVAKCLNVLNKLPYFKEKSRNAQSLTLENLFRGYGKGCNVGQYLSQFLLAGNNGRTQKGTNVEFRASEGKINYGSTIIDQKVRVAVQGEDYMTNWEEYYDVQNGANLRSLEKYVDGKEKMQRRFIRTGRDLGTYVHYDALYQAYLNACLILLDVDVEVGKRFDQGVPFQEKDIDDKQQGFAHYGLPHILTLVTEVATRALKAVRYQKFNVHRRIRPEGLAARLHKKDAIYSRCGKEIKELEKTFVELQKSGLWELISTIKNQAPLLPMAFCEGSPMHPSYGAGHATVAGACVTILKAFFNHELYLTVVGNETKNSLKLSAKKPEATKAFFAEGKIDSITKEEILSIKEKEAFMTLEGELNKLAANISIGRDWAGVHYYSDYQESLLLGEKIAIALLEEQAITYNPLERFYLTLPKFDGSKIRIDENGVHPIPAINQ